MLSVEAGNAPLEKGHLNISSPASLNCFTRGVPKCVAGAYYLSVL